MATPLSQASPAAPRGPSEREVGGSHSVSRKSMHRLPRRIIAVMGSTIVLFILTVSLSVYWMSRAMDQQAYDQSIVQARAMRANLLSAARLITLDYAKWDAAVAAMHASDATWIYDNIGSTAAEGLAVQMAVVWGGGFEGDLGWRDGHGRVPVTHLFSSDSRQMLEDQLAARPAGLADGVEFFDWSNDTLYAFGAARFEPVDDADLDDAPLGSYGLLVMGMRVTNSILASLAAGSSFDGIRIVQEPPGGMPFVPLSGPEGSPVAYLTWTQPRPGAAMLHRMLPALSIVVALTACLVALGMRLLRRNAQFLVLAEHQSATAARSDALTSLANRAAFSEVIDGPAPAGERAVLFLDINGFKRINDEFGHAAGDDLLVGIANRLTRLKRPGSLLARMAGDEFVILLTGADAGGRAASLARAVDDALSAPFAVLGVQLRVRAAIGYAVQVTDKLPGLELVRRADVAMYEAKRRQGGPVPFSPALDHAARYDRSVERALRDALGSSGQISVVYQPIVSLDGHLKRAEALARWTSPSLGAVPPSHFIAVAERVGLIHELGRTLIIQVCDDLAAHPRLNVSLNVSPHQLLAPDFVRELQGEVAARALDPRRIEVELTESVLIDDPHLALERLKELRLAGFSTALDDFGTGYSSIAYLEHLDFDTLKIDRSFVSQLRSSPRHNALLRAMIEMAHGLDLSVVCEGVEASEELSLLRELGCDLVQGFFMDQPLALDSLVRRWIKNPAVLVAA